MSRNAAENQLNDFKKGQKNVPVMTTGSGNPVDDKLNSLTVGPKGPILLQDFTLLDELSHFDRERIPERVVHAKGAGAFGYFEVTHDISKYCKAKVFSSIGKKTPIAVRFSTVGGESGSADTARDPRGFAVKFYTEEGNWDLVGNNTPIFFIRDPILFPSFIHTQKRNPVTHLKTHRVMFYSEVHVKMAVEKDRRTTLPILCLVNAFYRKDADMFWDFISLRPETTHQVMFLFSDRGTPDGYRFMNGYGSHTFKLVNSNNEPVYCKFHYKTAQGIKNLPAGKAHELSGSDPDYSIRDLYNAIASGNFPQWNFSIQVMTYEQAQNWKYNPFDLTKVWPHGEFPLIPVGKLVLDRNPSNYFTDVEQIAFSPAHFVPGIEPSPDKMLQGRLFSYSDTHRHRLGANYLQLPVNCPYRAVVVNTQRDGPACYTNNQGGAPNYFPNSFGGHREQPSAANTKFSTVGDVDRYTSDGEDNFQQCHEFWHKTLTEEGRRNLVDNIVGNLRDASDFIQERAVNNFSQVEPVFGARLAEGLRLAKKNKANL